MENIKKKYSNGEVTIVWRPKLCVHSGICFNQLPEVFDPLERPWVNPHGASTERIIEIVNRCPTRALTYELNHQSQEHPNEDKPAETTEVTIQNNGPLLIRGNFKIFDEEGNEVVTDGEASLCRCGCSKTKPFCDGSHEDAGFRE